jgi:predicted exporter
MKFRLLLRVGAPLVLLAVMVFVAATGRLHIETDLLSLLPSTARDATVERIANQWIAGNAQRSVFLIGHASLAQAKAQARRYAEALTAAGAFDDVHVTFPLPLPQDVHAVFLPYRFQLLAAETRSALTDQTNDDFIAARLQRRLYDPFRPSVGLPLAQDPLGLLDEQLARLPWTLPGVRLEPEADGMLLAHDRNGHYVLVVARVRGSTYDNGVQRAVQRALDQAGQAVRDNAPDVRILHTGAIHYAGVARAAAEREFDIIGFGSLVGIIAMLWLTLRSLRPVVLGLVSVALGVGVAALVTQAVFGNIHLITLVFGASLTGEAIDYSIQYFAARVHAGRQWEARRGLRAVMPGILIALATSVLGYATLALAPFPGLRQIALFAVTGLGVAALLVAFLLPAFLRKPADYRPTALLRSADSLLAACRRRCTPAVRALLIAAVVLVCAPGWWMITSQDDIRSLVHPDPTLASEENAIRELCGVNQSSQLFIVYGNDPQEVLQHEVALTARLRDAVQAQTLTGYQAISEFVPPISQQRENYRLLKQKVFADAAGHWRLQARKVGLRDDVARRYADDFKTSSERWLTPEVWFDSSVSAATRQLWVGKVDDRYFSIVLPGSFTSTQVLARAADSLPGVTLVDKPGQVSGLFRDYRRMSYAILVLATVLVGVLLLVRYGWRDGLQAMLPTASGIGVALAFFGYGGMPLTLFNSMALLLVLGVSVNYVIFLREGWERGGATLIGVVLSALTTLLSFGLLGWSSTPALAQFGSTLFVGIAGTVLLAPVLAPVRGGRR